MAGVNVTCHPQQTDPLPLLPLESNLQGQVGLLCTQCSVYLQRQLASWGPGMPAVCAHKAP